MKGECLSQSPGLYPQNALCSTSTLSQQHVTIVTGQYSNRQFLKVTLEMLKNKEIIYKDPNQFTNLSSATVNQ